ncbi:ATP-dependent helicase HrpB [soil metagenome]
MAQERGEALGQTVGFRIRGESVVSSKTRIEVVTEGVLTRMLLDDPSLDGVAAVVFDEFHERSLQADLGLALAIETRQVLRPDLRIVVMSATLDGQRVADLINGPLVTSHGRQFPVETSFLDRPPEGRIETLAADSVRRALSRHDGSILVFLPGAREIRTVASLLSQSTLPADVDVFPLFGALSALEQDRAIAAPVADRRKLVIATDIAETSLTIEGISVVVDSGLSRRPIFDVRSSLTRLVTLPASQASTDQRRGRAGRIGPGFCYRLWTQADHAARRAFDLPEILSADLAALVLDLASWGARSLEDVAWLDSPPEAAFALAQDLLKSLGAIDTDFRLTAHGQAMARLPLHPRLAHMLMDVDSPRERATAAAVAALLEERDPFRPHSGKFSPISTDFRIRLDALRCVLNRERPPSVQGASLHAPALTSAVKEARRILRYAGGRSGLDEIDATSAGQLLARAYPDRVAQRIQPGRYRLASGRSAVLPDHDPLGDEEYLVAASLDGKRSGARIFLAAPILREEIEQLFSSSIVESVELTWDDASEAFQVEHLRRLDALVVSRRTTDYFSQHDVAKAVLALIRKRGLEVLKWDRDSIRLRQRLAFVHSYDSERWPDVGDESLLASLEEWLLPHLFDARGRSAASIADLQRIDLSSALTFLLPPGSHTEFERLAPSHIEVPSGSRIAVDYSDPVGPVLAVKLQEVFGMLETPRIGGGQTTLTMHLLSPAQRPVQVTQDLASFWRSAYYEVRKDLRGRYPKHPWPEDPLSAPPTRRTNRRP